MSCVLFLAAQSAIFLIKIKPMNVLELYAGSRSIGKAAEELGMKVFSSDIEAFEGIDYAVNVLDFDVSKVPFKPDIIWASPPCTGFSVAAIGHHWSYDKKNGGGAYSKD